MSRKNGSTKTATQERVDIASMMQGTVDSPPAVTEVETEAVPEVQPEVTLRELVLPMGVRPDRSHMFNLNIQLDPAESAALQQLADGLDRERAILPDGTRCTSRRHAGRWLVAELAKLVMR